MGADAAGAPVARKAWQALVPVIEGIEREEAAHGLRVVSVAASVDQIPAADRDGRRIHPGCFGGWMVREATFDDPALEAVVGLSDGSNIGLTVDGSLVEVIHG